MIRLFNHMKAAGKLVFILFLIMLTFVYAMFQGGFVSWFLFFSFIPFGLYLLLLTIYPMKDFEVHRNIDYKHSRAGERFSATITISRKIPFPLAFIIVEEKLPVTLQRCSQSKPSKEIFFPWFRRRLQLQYEFDAIPRGEHIFEGVRVKTGDLFGLIEKEIMISLPDQLFIYPQYVDMNYRQISSRFEQGMTSSNVKIQRDTAIAVGIRDYKPGDRFSWIDWKASARKNDIMTKEFEQQQSHDVVIFMDRTHTNQFEQVVTFTASVARAILRKGAQISLISIGNEHSIIPLRGGEAQQQQVFYHLAKVQDDSKIPFSFIIEDELKKIYVPVIYLFITNQISNDLVHTAEKLSVKHISFRLFVVKEKGTQLSSKEFQALEAIRRRNVVVQIVYEGQFADVFYEVSKS